MLKLSLALSASFVVGQPAVLGSYCTSLASTCYGTFGLNATTCNVVMGNVTLGDQMDGDMNTIGCRMKYLTGPALYSGMANACRYAGPSGGGRCGAMISNVCDIATQACVNTGYAASQSVTPAFPDSATCQMGSPTGIGSLAHQWGSVQGVNGASQNSLECRLYHAITAVSSGDASHCTHYSLVSAFCTGKVTVDRAHYCDTLMYNCGNGTDSPNYAQFADPGECNATAAGYPNTNSLADDARDNGANNLGCREYHAQASKALGAGPTHCEHAGPSGAGVCGLRFQAWGSILAAPPCNDNSVNMFLTSVGNATANLAVPPGNVAGQYYSTTFDTSKNTQVCRIYHLGVASTHFAGPTGHCSHGAIDGAGQCGTLVSNACDFIGGICGFGPNATWQFASAAACITGLTNTATNNVTVGPIGDAAGNTLECRFYHAAVAASFLPTGSQGSTPGAAANVMTHCSHVLQIAPAGGCGYVAPVPSPTPGAKPSSAAALSLLASVFVVASSVLAL